MSIICRTWKHSLVASDAHTISITSAESADWYDVEVRFRLVATTPERAEQVAYDCLGLEEFGIQSTWREGGSDVTCTFGMGAVSHEDAHRKVCALWRGTPTWRQVIDEVQGWTRHLTNA